MAQATDDGIEIPHERLDPATLQRVLEDFVTREGTDYGGPECSLADKCAQVRAQLERGQAMLLFDPETATINFVLRGPDGLA